MPIIDELNNESSDSINFHLFFSEDSNSSENLQNKKKNNEVQSSIPLKQSPGKTNFLEISGSKCINASSKKKKDLIKTLGKTVFENEKGGTDKIMDKSGTHSSTEIKNSFNVNTKEKKIKQFVKHDDLNLNKDILAVQKKQGRKNTKDKGVPHKSHNQVNFERGATGTDKSMTMKKEIKKRKQREDDEGGRSAKVQRITSPENAIVPHLPPSILNKLQDKPKKKNLSVTKSKVISTSNFMVEEAKTVKNNYLEESVYLNEDELLESKKQKRIMNPKVLPFLPTVSTSISGYTTDFKVNVIPKELKFIAKSSNVSNFKNDYLENKKIKRLGTYGLYKKNRNVKLSKF